MNIATGHFTADQVNIHHLFNRVKSYYRTGVLSDKSIEESTKPGLLVKLKEFAKRQLFRSQLQQMSKILPTLSDQELQDLGLSRDQAVEDFAHKFDTVAE